MPCSARQRIKLCPLIVFFDASSPAEAVHVVMLWRISLNWQLFYHLRGQTQQSGCIGMVNPCAGFIGPQWSPMVPWPVQCSSSPRPGHFHTAPGKNSTMMAPCSRATGSTWSMAEFFWRYLYVNDVIKCSHTITRLSVCACVWSSMKMSLPQGNCTCPKPKLLCRGSLSNLSRPNRRSQLQRAVWMTCTYHDYHVVGKTNS